MSSCVPTLTVFPFTTSAATTTTFSLTLQTQPDGSVSTVTVPRIITSVITFNRTATVFAGCSSSSSLTVTHPITTSQSTMTPPPIPSISTSRSSSSSPVPPGVVTTSIPTVSRPTTPPPIPSISTSRSSSSSPVPPGVVTTSIPTVSRPTTPPPIPSISTSRSSSSSPVPPGVVTTFIPTASRPTTPPPIPSISTSRLSSSSPMPPGVVTTSIPTISQPTTAPRIPSISASRSGSFSLSGSSSSSLRAPGVVTTSIPTISRSTMTPSQPSSTLFTGTITTAQPPKITARLITDEITFTVNSTPSRTSNIAPIVGGAVGGFFIIIGVVAITWFIRKKSRRYKAVSLEEKDIVFPCHVARGQYQSKQLDSANESHDGGLSAALIDMSDVGLTPTTSGSGSLATLYGVPTRVGEVGRQASHNSDPFSPDAVPLDQYSHSGGSVGAISSHRRLLQAINSPPSSMPPQLGSSSGDVVGSISTPIAGHGTERQSPWSEKTHG